MRKRAGRAATKASLSVVGVVLAIAAPAVAATPSNHKVAVMTVARPLYGLSSNFSATGTIAGKPFGRGALIRHVTSSGSSVSVRFIWFATNGSVRGTATENRTFNPNGSISFTVKGRILGGSGTYRGATGTFSGTGYEPNLNSPVTDHLRGKVKY